MTKLPDADKIIDDVIASIKYDMVVHVQGDGSFGARFPVDTYEQGLDAAKVMLTAPWAKDATIYIYITKEENGEVQ